MERSPRKRPRRAVTADCTVPRKKRKSIDHTLKLPDEMLIHIFSLIDQATLYKNVRCVCTRWYRLVSTPTLWQTISADRTVPTKVLCKWIEQSPLLRRISCSNRNDMNTIAQTIWKHSPKLRSITARNCWGSNRSRTIRGRSICQLLEKCRSLRAMDFSNNEIRSMKFFRLLGNSGLRSKKGVVCTYQGPVNEKQLETLLNALLDDPEYTGSTFYTPRKKQFHFTRARTALAAQSLWRIIGDEEAEDSPSRPDVAQRN